MRLFGHVFGRIAIVVAFLTATVPAVVITASPAHAIAAPGGPVILDGMDPGYHGYETAGVPQGAWLYIAKAYTSLMTAASTGTAATVAVIGPADSTATSDDCGAGAHWAASNDGYTPTFYSTPSAIGTFFTQLAAGTVSPAPRIIHIVDTVCDANPLSPVEAAVLVTHATDIANFVDAGGGLLADTEAYCSCTDDAWLTKLIPTITVPTGGGGSPQLTVAGQATLPGLTNADIAVPWHSHFSGNLDGLQVLATDSGSNVIIGGSPVTIPGLAMTVTSSASPITPGQSETITGNVTDNAAVVVSGATVTFSVTSGPNSGMTGTAVSDASGNAAWTYTGGLTTGTDSITGSTVVSATIESGSTNVTWATLPGVTAAPVATRGDAQASVAVSAPVSDGGSPITGYRVTASPGGLQAIGASSPVAVAGLTNGTAYTFTVAAANGIGYGPESPASNIVIPAGVPVAPTIVSATLTAGSLAVVLSDANPNGSPVSSYTVTIMPGNIVRSGLSPITVTGLIAGATYTITATATNGVGTSAPSSPRNSVLSPGDNSGPMAATPDGKGYWMVSPNGLVTAYGDAQPYGSADRLVLNQPIVAIQSTPDGKGYWLAARDGGVFTFGDAGYYGSTGGMRLNRPVIGMAASPDGMGYWLVASDGGIFTFGDAGFYGSAGGMRLNQPVTGMRATPAGTGYWLVASDGGIFTFGDAGFYGSMPGK